MKRGVLALDYGAKKTGFASADPMRVAVAPLEVLRTEGDDELLFARVGELLAERDVEVLLVGMPGGTKGRAGGRVEATQRFVERLRARFPDQRVVTHDETLTTKEAEARIREAGHDARRSRALRDSWSAWVLLEDWIESGEPG